ncbi:hypothetical protein [Actinokineospora cianjurensis]|uniref:Uncharacterized protein n=1 Tax=Actinokineospora cianjurensis TaxID=585224 RepID=A0A421AZQ0_9PSEU|nr:hypothetical protein [Actinokineospora cianjurensis]RLK55332.1 hypothetical protein CLV68_4817 [Actinokineospora cianjurensis]
MTSTHDSPVAAPREGVVAAHDPTTSILMWVWHLRYRSGASTRALTVVSSMLLLFAIAMFFLAESTNTPLPIILLVNNALILIGYWLPGSHYRWVRSTLQQLTTHPWRAVSTRVLRAGRWSSVVEVVDDGAPVVFRVWIDPAHRAMITDTAYLIRERGKRAVLRVPGSREMFPARVREPISPGEVPAVSVTERWAGLARDRLLWMAAQLVLVFGVISLVSALIWFSPYAIALAAGVFVCVLAVAAFVMRQRLADFRLPALVASGEWVRAAAALGNWTARRDGTATAVATLRLDDGTVRVVTMPAASVDLLGAVVDSGSLWVTGTEGTVAVGFPGYPLLATGTIARP